MTLMFPE